MRHAARLPPPPVFNDRRLLLLIAFCKSQSIDHSFGVCVFCLRLTLAHFCRYLYVLDVCCQFASCQAMLAICKSYCKISPKCIKNNAQIDTNSSKIRPKSTKMVPRRVPKAILRASRFHVLPPTKFLVPFWSNSDDVAWHFVPSWAPRGSQNQAFWHQVALKSQKMTS